MISSMHYQSSLKGADIKAPPARAGMAGGGDAELVAQFVSVTGASADEAKRFLHSSGGALEQAINLYFGALPSQQRRWSSAHLLFDEKLLW